MKKEPLEVALASLRGVDPGTLEGRKRLIEALGDARAPMAARAAELARDAGRDVGPALVAAFSRCLKDPIKRDPGCKVKRAAIEALDALDWGDPEPFRFAAAHVQKEPAWGPPVDTAPGLRAAGAWALVRLRTDDALQVLADLLLDPEPPARLGAVDGIEGWGTPEAAALLRLKAQLPEEEPNVAIAALRGLARLDRAHGLAWVAARLDHADVERREEAAFGLGESRLPEALAALVAWRERLVLDRDRSLAIAAIGLLRVEGAQAALVEGLGGGKLEATAAVEALAAYRSNPGTEDAVRAAAARRPELRAIAEERFGPADAAE